MLTGSRRQMLTPANPPTRSDPIEISPAPVQENPKEHKPARTKLANASGLYNGPHGLIVPTQHIMEPAAAIASIVSLLRIFKQEQGERKEADHQAFMEWLEYHHHEELKNLIVNTAALSTEVDKVLAADHALMLQKLDGIQTIVATFLSRVDEFHGLSLAVAPDAQLSEQAMSVLRQFVHSGAEILYYASYGAGQFSLQPENGEPFGVTEPRFLKNDLDQLVELGLFSVEYNSDGNPLFGLTRSGIRYLQAIDSKVSAPNGQRSG